MFPTKSDKLKFKISKFKIFKHVRVNYQIRPRKKEKVESPNFRLNLAILFCGLAFLFISLRLFTLMILQHSFYSAIASGSHNIYKSLFSKRGEIFLKSENGDDLFPLAINRDFYTVYSNDILIKDNQTAEDILAKLSEVFSYDDERKAKVLAQLEKKEDPYEPLEKKVDEETVDKLKAMNLVGIGFKLLSQRYYPEGSLAAQVIGFLGEDESEKYIGRYGLEGYWQQDLAGSGGFLEGGKSAKGSWVFFVGRRSHPAK